jgi:hypothetical protein
MRGLGSKASRVIRMIHGEQQRGLEPGPGSTWLSGRAACKDWELKRRCFTPLNVAPKWPASLAVF